jgi:hypothetical protein
MGAGVRGGPGEVARAVAVDARGGRFLGLGAVDVRPRGAVEDRLRRGRADRGGDRGGVGDVEVAAGERRDVVARGVGGGDDILPEHARGTGHEKAHRLDR